MTQGAGPWMMSLNDDLLWQNSVITARASDGQKCLICCAFIAIIIIHSHLAGDHRFCHTYRRGPCILPLHALFSFVRVTNLCFDTIEVIHKSNSSLN